MVLKLVLVLIGSKSLFDMIQKEDNALGKKLRESGPVLSMVNLVVKSEKIVQKVEAVRKLG